MSDHPYTILFEPVRIGPVTAPNRFFQVPHCNGMGHARPQMLAAMRGIKAEGGWGVVCTEEVEIHPTSDLSPHVEGRLWDDADRAGLAAMVDAVHAHGALAGIELAHNGYAARNLDTRLAPLAPSPRATKYLNPYTQARGMSKADIAAFRQWHRDAVRRALDCGYDIIYVYAAHNLSLLAHFLSRRYNQRTDEYGGSFENRTRLLREVLADTREIVAGRSAVALRFAVDELLGADGLTPDGEGRAVVELLADSEIEPDLWDVNVAEWSNDSVTSRFAQEGYQEDAIRFVKQVTQKPVVGVGRYTSPDSMVRLIRSGVMDLIGAARPSIADPFLPQKVREGRLEDIRECIGCNICVSGDQLAVPIRCTQNPSMGEEWRRGWHPERMNPAHAAEAVLVVGGGPAGLEAALSLARRGYEVTLAEASERLGGRVLHEAALPGLAEWKRVADYRIGQLQRLPKVQIALSSRLASAEILEFGAPHVVLATGARWRRDGTGYTLWRGFENAGALPVFTPDDWFAGARPHGRVAIYDDDHYYLASVLAEALAAQGCAVEYICPQPAVAVWTDNTLEQARIQRRLLERGVRLHLSQSLAASQAQGVLTRCVYTSRERAVACDALLLVSSRLPNDELLNELDAAQFATLRAIGDANAPGIIAAAVWDGHRAARELGSETGAVRRERAVVVSR